MPVLWAAALLAISCCGATAIAAVNPGPSPKSKLRAMPKLGGTWSGQYSGAFSGSFTLHWTQSRWSKSGVARLHGSITLSSPPGKYSITGSVRGSGAIRFGAVGAGATYTGKVSGKSMSGSYRTPQGGGKWSAGKTR